MRDVKENNWLPSVTTIISDIAAPDLSFWKEEQILKAAYEMPAIHAETYEEWTRSIRERATAGTVEAADFGTDVHALIEYMIKEDWPKAADTQAYRAAEAGYVAFRALELKEVKSEAIEVNRAIGYAGTVDISGYCMDPEGMFDLPTVPVIADVKTKRTKPGEPIKEVETYPWQLAAYHVSRFGTGQRELHPHARACNIYISSTEPGRCETVWYDRRALEIGLEAFLCCHRLFCIRHNYTPKTSR